MSEYVCVCVSVCVGRSQSLETEGGSHGNHRRGLLQPTHLCLGTCPGTMAVWERDCSTKELFRDNFFFDFFRYCYIIQASAYVGGSGSIWY